MPPKQNTNPPGILPHRYNSTASIAPKDNTTIDMSRAASCCIIENFRPVLGTSNIYRCASTDGIGNILAHEGRQELTGPDKFIFHVAGLILDLRSSSERNESQAQKWMARVVPDIIVIEDDEVIDMVPQTNSTTGMQNAQRFVVRIDVLSPSKFMSYITENWLTPMQQTQIAFLDDEDKLHEIRMESLNKRGLAGLNEVILETGKAKLCHCLQTMTLYLEENKESYVVFRCVQGKDRTGMLAMLLQSILGLSDDKIILDYFKSNQMRTTGSAALRGVRKRRRGKLDRNTFAGTNEEAMVRTLQFLRTKYGSVLGYLNTIGFTESWRQRLLAVLKRDSSRSRL